MTRKRSEFQSDEEFVQYLIDEYSKIVTEEYNIVNEKKLLIYALNEGCNRTNKKNTVKTRGTVKCQGTTHEAVLTRRENVSYDKDRSEEHPLKTLIDNHPNLADRVRLSYSESGQKIAKLLQSVEAGEVEESKELSEIKTRRIVSAGTPGVEIKELKRRND